MTNEATTTAASAIQRALYLMGGRPGAQVHGACVGAKATDGPDGHVASRGECWVPMRSEEPARRTLRACAVAITQPLHRLARSPPTRLSATNEAKHRGKVRHAVLRLLPSHGFQHQRTRHRGFPVRVDAEATRVASALHDDDAAPTGVASAPHRHRAAPPGVASALHDDDAAPTGVASALHDDHAALTGVASALHRHRAAPPGVASALHDDDAALTDVVIALHRHRAAPPGVASALHDDDAALTGVASALHRHRAAPTGVASALHDDDAALTGASPALRRHAFARTGVEAAMRPSFPSALYGGPRKPVAYGTRKR
jgi:hypothetical protein